MGTTGQDCAETASLQQEGFLMNGSLNCPNLQHHRNAVENVTSDTSHEKPVLPLHMTKQIINPTKNTYFNLLTVSVSVATSNSSEEAFFSVDFTFKVHLRT